MNSAQALSRIPLVALVLAAPLAAQSTTRVSVSSTGAQGNQSSQSPAISHDGSRVAFESIASTLVAGDSNNASDIFVHDRPSGLTKRISVATGGAQSNGYSSSPSISADGQLVAFLSNASNLVAGDTNSAPDVYVHDLSSGVTKRVNVSSAGAQANGVSYAPTISADGRFVAFHSAATNLVAGDTNGQWDIFVHDLQTGATIRGVASSTGGQPNGHCAAPSLSADGRFLAFHSNASNLIAGDTNAAWDIFVRDLQTGATIRASVSSSGVAANSNSADASLSADGRFVAFHSAATNLVPGDLNGFDDVFLHDRQTGATVRISVATDDSEGDNASRTARISSDGRYIAFESQATNFYGADTNWDWDVFVHDRLGRVTSIVSVDDTLTAGDNGSTGPAISAYGRHVAFHSYATSLVPGDTNNTRDVFLRTRGPEAPVVYCTAGTTTLGCVPSIAGVGFASASNPNGFWIQVSGVDGQRSGLVFYGTNGPSDWPWSSTSSSFMCVKAPTQRLPLQSTNGVLGTCSGSIEYDFLAFMAANPGALGQPLTPGETFFAQCWFRDPPASKSTNLSAGLAFTLEP